MTVSGPIQFDEYQREEFRVTEEGRLMDERGGEFARLLIMDGDDLEPLAGTRWSIQYERSANGWIHRAPRNVGKFKRQSISNHD